MLLFRLNTIVTRKVFVTRFAFAATKKRSYYQILGIEGKCSQRQLKKKYLMKARKYHPDHNQQPGALEEFKLIKQAYETLKDPQKKMMYDSGVSQTPDEVTPVHDNEVQQGRKYYENKWYGYKKPNDHDIRDEYYQVKADYYAQKPVNPLRYIASFTCVVLALFGYDFISKMDTEKQRERQEARKVLERANVDQATLSKRQKVLQRYMEIRQKEHKVDI